MRRKDWIKELGMDILTGVILGAMLSLFLYIFLIRMSQMGGIGGEGLATAAIFLVIHCTSRA